MSFSVFGQIESDRRRNVEAGRDEHTYITILIFILYYMART